MSECRIPDFGIPNQCLFEEMKVTSFQISQKGLEQIEIKKSLWNMFYDCIQYYPKYQKLRNMIEKSNQEAMTLEQEEKRQKLQKYLLQKQLQEEKRKQMLLEKANGGSRARKKEKEQRKFYKEKRYSSTVLSSDKSSNKQGSIYDDVDEIMNDDEMLKHMQKMIDEKNQKPETG